MKCLRKESFKDSANKNPVPAVLECYMCEKNREVPMLYKAALVLRGVPEKTRKRQLLTQNVMGKKMRNKKRGGCPGSCAGENRRYGLRKSLSGER